MTLKPNRDRVVLVHGIWMPGWVMCPLAARLKQAGYRTDCYAYPSRRLSVRENATRLARYLTGLPASKNVHLVGHSLGGRVILRMLHEYPNHAPGRIVLLGSPVRGSSVACYLAERSAGRWLLGKSCDDGLLSEQSSGFGNHEIGVIAGTYGVGIGRMLGVEFELGDGTVGVAETLLDDARDSLLLPVTHTGMLFSAEVARAVCRFLKNGQFTDHSQ